jgi:type II secretory pathway predicted ATPase ExeA
VVIIDEAHPLSAEQEDVRMLTNHDMDARSAFACLLIGQPTLRRVKTGTLAALDQRIALRYHLDGMDLGETVGYIKHHLQLAGRSDTIFTDATHAVGDGRLTPGLTGSSADIGLSGSQGVAAALGVRAARDSNPQPPDP